MSAAAQEQIEEEQGGLVADSELQNGMALMEEQQLRRVAAARLQQALLEGQVRTEPRQAERHAIYSGTWTLHCPLPAP